MKLCYSQCSRIGAGKIAAESENIQLTFSSNAHANWGKERADTLLNPDISNVTNKRRMRELFKEHGVPMPRLLTRLEAEMYAEDGNIVIGRPDKHTKKRGYWRCKSYEDVQRALRGTRKKRPATHFMEYIEADHEYRVHIFRGKSIRISEKKFFMDANGKRDYTTIKPTGDMKYVRRAAKKAVKAVGLDFGAVDILSRDDDCFTLEVNAAPGLGGSMPRVYAEAFETWYEQEV
jgi:glutathione synthase/RimK-type ligase-like ATP-grasp enzyme